MEESFLCIQAHISFNLIQTAFNINTFGGVGLAFQRMQFAF